MIYVVAGCHNQYLSFLRENNLTPRQAKFVCMAEDVHGIVGGDLAFYGTPENNKMFGDSYLRHLLKVGVLRTYEPKAAASKKP
ncbi:hypothetical protein [Candidatus Manganitrophus noduliformans]|uniref:Uncharacterized protein n=1 Tax=Candidatus Manganitrophus noduliformans TaxID=2606439 RepID=A0A7X6I9V1_9BACT|nr:hypothetical protein [Candidatus Manganitrophus noduliformans]NKE69878.1 hypothetical protein [Candidatus Manganitrophus noduliformans]